MQKINHLVCSALRTARTYVTEPIEASGILHAASSSELSEALCLKKIKREVKTDTVKPQIDDFLLITSGYRIPEMPHRKKSSSQRQSLSSTKKLVYKNISVETRRILSSEDVILFKNETLSKLEFKHPLSSS